MKNTLSYLRKNWGVLLWAGGIVAFIVGDAKEANDADSGDTFSERWIKQAEIVRAVGYAAIGGVLVHLARWTIGSPVTVNAETVSVKGDVNIEEKP